MIIQKLCNELLGGSSSRKLLVDRDSWSLGDVSFYGRWLRLCEIRSGIGQTSDRCVDLFLVYSVTVLLHADVFITFLLLDWSVNVSAHDDEQKDAQILAS